MTRQNPIGKNVKKSSFLKIIYLDNIYILLDILFDIHMEQNAHTMDLNIADAKKVKTEVKIFISGDGSACAKVKRLQRVL